MTLHDTDFHAWTREQAELLRRRSANALDWAQLAEELDCLGVSEVRELRSRFIALITHLLKWEFQPERRGRSWRATIDIQRRELDDHLRKNPSLKPVEAEEFESAYATARLQASGETDLPLKTFPLLSPYKLDESRDEHFWPGGPPAEDDEA